MLNLKIRLLAAAALLTAVLVPSAALAAPTQYIRCTVGYVGGSQYVVVGLASVNSQALVQDDAAVCSYLISTGDWVGVDKFREWDNVAGVDRQCQVELDSANSVIVWSKNDASSLVLAGAVCTTVAQASIA